MRDKVIVKNGNRSDRVIQTAAGSQRAGETEANTERGEHDSEDVCHIL